MIKRMTSKTITFYHSGNQVSAKAFYDDKDLKTILLMFPEDLTSDFDESVLFSKDKNEGWKTASYFSSAHPETIKSIISAFEGLEK